LSYAILRIDGFHAPDTPIEMMVTVKGIVGEYEKALSEVARLNALRPGDDTIRYFWQYARDLDAPKTNDDDRRVCDASATSTAPPVLEGP